MVKRQRKMTAAARRIGKKISGLKNTPPRRRKSASFTRWRCSVAMTKPSRAACGRGTFLLPKTICIRSAKSSTTSEIYTGGAIFIAKPNRFWLRRARVSSKSATATACDGRNVRLCPALQNNFAKRNDSNKTEIAAEKLTVTSAKSKRE